MAVYSAFMHCVGELGRGSAGILSDTVRSAGAEISSRNVKGGIYETYGDFRFSVEIDHRSKKRYFYYLLIVWPRDLSILSFFGGLGRISGTSTTLQASDSWFISFIED